MITDQIFHFHFDVDSYETPCQALAIVNATQPRMFSELLWFSCQVTSDSLRQAPVYGISQATVLECVPSPGHLPNPGIEPASPALACGFFTTGPPGKHFLCYLLPTK